MYAVIIVKAQSSFIIEDIMGQNGVKTKYKILSDLYLTFQSNSGTRDERLHAIEILPINIKGR